MSAGISITTAIVCIVLGVILVRTNHRPTLTNRAAVLLLVLGGMGIMVTPFGTVIRNITSAITRWVASLEFDWATREVAAAVPIVLAVLAGAMVFGAVLGGRAEPATIILALAFPTLLLAVDGPVADAVKGLLEAFSSGFTTLLSSAQDSSDAVDTIRSGARG